MSQVDEAVERVPIADPAISTRAQARVASVLNSGQLTDGERMLFP